MTSAVKVEHVSKKYALFASKRDRVREVLDPWRRSFHRDFWALRDINLDIARGQTVGILGLNGSGKSTLLQIISSVLQPTMGRVTVQGKVAALLELGAGFNPELTGRENVVLNGTIMGLSRSEIAARMPDIEAFADIGEFFDQPMRTCSSGMFMRVAFSTALYVDPDVLIIDEALSVGDAKFQEKCFRRFRSFQAAGKTILFVTHDRAAVPRHCDLAVLLHRGEVVDVNEPGYIADLYGEVLAFGRVRRLEGPAGRSPEPGVPAAPAATSQPVEALVQAFIEDPTAEDRCAANPTYNKYEHRFGNQRAAIVDYAIVDGRTLNPPTIAAGSSVDVYFKVVFHHEVMQPIVGMILKDKEGVIAHGVNTEWMRRPLREAPAGAVRVYRFTVQLNLCAGDWFIDLAVAESGTDLCDNRGALAHVYLTETRQYWGLARLDTEFLELETSPASPAPPEAPPEWRTP